MSDSDFMRLAPAPGTRIAVAGGCGGFGRPLVAACLAGGLRVAVLDLPHSIERHPPPEGALAIPVDATDPADVATAFAAIDREWGALDSFVYLVGYTLTPPPRLDDVAPEQWDDIQGGNIRGAFLTSRAALPLLRAAGGGTIVTVASALGYNVLPGFGPYATAKAGLVALTKALAVENAPAIRANSVAPSAAHTAFMGGGTGRGGDEGGHEWFTDGAVVPPPPLGRFCQPEDVIGPILFLAGDGSRFMTGQVLHVNGGRLTP